MKMRKVGNNAGKRAVKDRGTNRAAGKNGQSRAATPRVPKRVAGNVR